MAGMTNGLSAVRGLHKTGMLRVAYCVSRTGAGEAHGGIPQVTAAIRVFPRITALNTGKINLNPGKNRRHSPITGEDSEKTARKRPYIRIYPPLFASRDGGGGGSPVQVFDHGLGAGMHAQLFVDAADVT